MLDRFFTSYDKATLEELLSDNAQIVEQSPKSRTYNKSEWINVLTNHVVPAIPNYKWCHATDATKDKDGYCLVTVQVQHLPLHFCCPCISAAHATQGYACVSQVSAYVSSCLQATGHHTGKPLRIPGSEMAKVIAPPICRLCFCCCVCPLSTLQQMARNKSLQWLSCYCMQLDTTQKKFTLQEASLKVKIEDGQIQEISVSICELDSFPPCA